MYLNVGYCVNFEVEQENSSAKEGILGMLVV